MNGITSIKPIDILNGCEQFKPSDKDYTTHPVINKYGSPQQPIYIDQSTVTANGIIYDSPLILPIYNARLELIQCALLQDKQPVGIHPDDGLAKGFTYYGDMQKDKPVIVVYSLEAFFKVATTGYNVVLVMLSKLRQAHESNLKDFEFKQIQFVIDQLAHAGYNRLYMPVRPELMNTALFQQLQQETAVRLLNQSLIYGENNLLLELSKDEDSKEVRIFLDEAIAQLPQHKNDWGELLPIAKNTAISINPYPIHALPVLARGAVEAIAEYVQAPISMTAQCVIGAMSHIAQAHVNAPHPFNISGEPCSLYLLTEGQSGSRKSTSRALADKAIIDHEQKEYERYRQDLEQWKSGLASLEKKERESYSIENPPPQDPSTRYGDVTLESLAGLYIDGLIKNASIASDEAGQFFGGHSMKADTRNQVLGGYAKIFDDGYIERTRSKSNLNGSGRVHDVRLTFNLQGQHEVLCDAIKDPVLRGQGFLPRFLLAKPENLAGTRLQDIAYRSKNANQDHRLIAYWARCQSLLDDTPQPTTDKQLHNGRYVIPMDEQAKQVDIAYYNLFEQMQGKGQGFEYLQAFASRASQLARRLATVLAYFEGLQWIDAKTLKGACEIINHSLNEWASYAEVEPHTESDTERLIKWFIKYCMNKSVTKLPYSSFMNNCPRPMRGNKQLLESIVNELMDSNYIKVDNTAKTRYVVINPILLENMA